MKTQKLDSVQADVKSVLGDFTATVTEWNNGEGVDVSICKKYIIQSVSYTYSEIDAIMAIVNALRSGVLEDEGE